MSARKATRRPKAQARTRKTVHTPPPSGGASSDDRSLDVICSIERAQGVVQALLGAFGGEKAEEVFGQNGVENALNAADGLLETAKKAFWHEVDRDAAKRGAS